MTARLRYSGRKLSRTGYFSFWVILKKSGKIPNLRFWWFLKFHNMSESKFPSKALCEGGNASKLSETVQNVHRRARIYFRKSPQNVITKPVEISFPVRFPVIPGRYQGRFPVDTRADFRLIPGKYQIRFPVIPVWFPVIPIWFPVRFPVIPVWFPVDTRADSR